MDRRFTTARAVNEVFGMSPTMDRAAFLPVGREPGGETEFAWPGLLYDAARALVTPGVGMKGGEVTQDDITRMAMETGILGSVARRPANSVGMFGGVGAKTADLSALGRAHELLTQGADAKKIWDETGWFQGADGKWRFEIDDRGVGLRNDSERLAIADNMRSEARKLVQGVNERNAVLKTQPDLFPGDVRRLNGESRRDAKALRREATSNFGPEALHGNRAEYAVKGNLGDYYPELMRETIVRREGAPVGVQGWHDAKRQSLTVSNNAEDPDSTLKHELQHAIQHREGFAAGGNPAEFNSEISRQLAFDARDAIRWRQEVAAKMKEFPGADRLAAENAVTQDYIELGAKDLIPNEGAMRLYNDPSWSDEDLVNQVKMFGLDQHLEPLPSGEIYRRLAGEVEARNVQTRRDFTPDQRRASPPWETEDVPRDKQIVRFRGGIRNMIMEGR